MGMVLALRRADAATLELLRKNPESATDFVCPEDDDYDPEDLVDFDKAWHALHFMLAGIDYAGDGPLVFLLNEYEALGEDQGYGPAWIVPTDAITRFHDAFQQLSDSELADRFDPAAMVEADIYLSQAFAEDDRAESIEYIMQSVPDFRSLIEKCVTTKSSLIGMIV